MTIEINEELVGLWFVQLPGHDDWQAGLKEMGRGFELTFRFRIADPLEPGADPFELIDEKHWFTARFMGGREDAIRLTDKMAAQLGQAAGNKPYKLLMNPERDIKAFIEEFKKQPWVHYKELGPEEAKQYMEDQDNEA